MSTSHIPAGYHSVTPYIFVRGAAEAIAFYELAFGACEVTRLSGPDGQLMHAEIKIGNAHVMLADEAPDMDMLSPQTLGGASSSLLIYVKDVDAVFAQALAAGASEMRAVEDQFWGDRVGTIVDPYGHQWSIATHIESMSEDEMRARYQDFLQQMQAT